jgi:hypothetical protein
LNEEDIRRRISAELAGNDAKVRRGSLDSGRAIAEERTATYDRAVADWAARLDRESGDDQSFALVALGGTGRQEVCPCSDLDYAVLVAGEVENHPLVAEIQQQTLNTGEFEQQHGFEFEAFPHDLQGVIEFTDPRQLNSFLDMRPVYDPGGLAPRFRTRIAETFDPFEHFLHLRSFWVSQWEIAAEQVDRLDRFDIKNDGLRLFLAAVWLLAGKGFRHSHEIYPNLDPRALDAYALLLRVRQFIHLRCRNSGERPAPLPDGRHAEDVLGFDDFLCFGDMLEEEAGDVRRFEFSNEVRARLLAARRRVAVFAKGVIGQELRLGRPVAPGSPHHLGAGGLWSEPPQESATHAERSRAALALLVASQRYELPIDPFELQGAFENAGEWLTPVPELADLLYEQGSLADSFTFLSHIPGAEERLFPGYGRFEASLDGRVMTEKTSLRGSHANAKIRALETWVATGKQLLDDAVSSSRLKDLEKEGVTVEVEAAQLDHDQLAAVKLALKTKRLPLTPADSAARDDTSLPLHARFASGISEIPVDEYYRPYAEACGLADEVIELTAFLVGEQRALRSLADVGLAEGSLVDTLVERCGDERRLRCLFVFTCADRAEWHSELEDPARWFSLRELYFKAMQRLCPSVGRGRPFLDAGFTEEDLAVFHGFGTALSEGSYRLHALRFASPLLRLASNPEEHKPKATVFRDGRSPILGVACRDFRGLATIITGALLTEGFDLVQAHLFSSSEHSLALDFFHLGNHPDPAALTALPARIEEAIRNHVFIEPETPLAHLPCDERGECSIEEWRPGLFCLRVATGGDQSTGAIIHTLVQTVYHNLHGNVHALRAHSTRGRTFVSVYHSMPDELPLEEARRILRDL